MNTSCNYTDTHTLDDNNNNNNNNTLTTALSPSRPYSLWAGLSLALLSSLLVGASVILKKSALLRLAQSGRTRAGDGGHGYLKDFLWWAGLVTMGAGEACNFAAYMFAPATLVTPLGALSVLVSAVLSSYLLGEELNVLGKLGCVLCVLGSILLVIHAPQEQEVTSLQDMTNKLLEPGFLVYAAAVLLLCVVLIVYLSPRRGQSDILIYIGVCSLLGAFTVASVKGLAIVISNVLTDVSVVCHPLTWILLLTLVVSMVTQVNYLNKSLDCFGPLVVYPLYYVLFTSVVLVTSVILFQEWTKMAAVDVVTALGSFLVIVVGVAMLHLFRDLQVTMKHLTNQLHPHAEREELRDEDVDDEGIGGGGATGGGGGATGGGGGATGGGGGATGGSSKKEDKDALIDNIVLDTVPPITEETHRVFVIS